jgi:hypothetical protein
MQEEDIDEETAIENSKKLFRCISIFNDNKKHEMPLVKNIGDIILLRVCQCCKYKEQEQFNVNLQWHSEFLLFDSKELSNDEILRNPDLQF